MTTLGQPSCSPFAGASADSDVLSVKQLLKNYPDVFVEVIRVDASDLNALQIIEGHEREGIPLIIEGWHKHEAWRRDLFNIEWLLEHECTDITVRNVRTWTDSTMNISDFISMSRSAGKCNDRTDRLYGKDLPCPDEWAEWLRRACALPSCLVPGGSNDLLPENVETLMCYIGIEGTWTPAHKDLCASSGQNLMCYAEDGGFSFWFMTDSASSPEAVDYFHNLAQELDHETYLASAVDFAGAAGMHIYICEQTIGDLILVPPRSCHQVVNFGGLTVKTSWSRMTLAGLEAALYHELPIYQRVCRRETYRVKSTIHAVLRQKSSLLANDSDPSMANELLRLIRLFEHVLIEEYPPEDLIDDPSSPDQGIESNSLSCDFCGADIFQSYFECDICTPISYDHDIEAGQDKYCICSRCFADGRACECRHMNPRQFRSFKSLIQDYQEAVDILARYKGNHDVTETCPSVFPISDTERAIFRAACGLQQYRQSRECELQSCSVQRRDITKHQVPLDSLVRCQKCRRALCFDHILEIYNAHFVKAFTLRAADDSCETWHRYHLSSRKIHIEEMMEEEHKQEKAGSVPKRFPAHMTRLAKRFSHCKPLSRNVTPGWYDRKVEILPIPTDIENLNTTEDATDDGQCRPQSISSNTIATSPSSSPTKRKYSNERTPNTTGKGQTEQDSSHKRARTWSSKSEQLIGPAVAKNDFADADA